MKPFKCYEIPFNIYENLLKSYETSIISIKSLQLYLLNKKK